MKHIYTLPNCRKSRELKRTLNMKGVAFSEHSAGIFTNPLFDGEDVDIEAYQAWLENDKETPVEVEYNGL